MWRNVMTFVQKANYCCNLGYAEPAQYVSKTFRSIPAKVQFEVTVNSPSTANWQVCQICGLWYYVVWHITGLSGFPAIMPRTNGQVSTVVKWFDSSDTYVSDTSFDSFLNTRSPMEEVRFSDRSSAFSPKRPQNNRYCSFSIWFRERDNEISPIIPSK